MVRGDKMQELRRSDNGVIDQRRKSFEVARFKALAFLGAAKNICRSGEVTVIRIELKDCWHPSVDHMSTADYVSRRDLVSGSEVFEKVWV
jgi:hypothetical protein